MTIGMWQNEDCCCHRLSTIYTPLLHQLRLPPVRRQLVYDHRDQCIATSDRQHQHDKVIVEHVLRFRGNKDRNLTCGIRYGKSSRSFHGAFSFSWPCPSCILTRVANRPRRHYPWPRREGTSMKPVRCRAYRHSPRHTTATTTSVRTSRPPLCVCLSLSLSLGCGCMEPIWQLTYNQYMIK